MTDPKIEAPATADSETSGVDAVLRCGYIAVVGAPNAGKSTLVNHLVGAKVSIVTPKVQTTRSRILGVAARGAVQMIYVDTPGIFQPRRRLDRAMVAAAWGGVADGDVTVLLIDVKRGLDGDFKRIMEGLEKSNRKAVLALNKIDLIPRTELLGLASELDATGLFTDIFMISALKGDGMEDLAAALAPRLPEGPWLFPEDQLSDLNDRLFAAEITREKLYLRLHQELPYALTVETEGWELFRNGDVRIEQTIYVERASQKGIVLGKGGERIKAIREEAIADIQEFLGCKVHLFIFVKVREKWGDDPERYRDWGLDFNA
ncbi:MAG: GTPase Era [Rhodospirillales bacterium]|nr:GTPase Era [Rhodospirillales bacterium]